MLPRFSGDDGHIHVSCSKSGRQLSGRSFGNLYGDCRKRLDVFRQHSTHFAGGYGGSEPSFQHACFSAVGQLRRRDHIVDFVEEAAGGWRQARASRGKAHSSTGALEQQDAKLLFEMPNAAAKCRLLDVEGCRGLPKTPMLGSREYASQRTEIEVHFLTVCLPRSWQ